MIRVAENDLRAHFIQLARINRLDAALRAHGLNTGVSTTPCAVVNLPNPRLCGARRFQKFKHWRKDFRLKRSGRSTGLFSGHMSLR